MFLKPYLQWCLIDSYCVKPLVASITLSDLNIVKHCLHVWPGTLFIKLSAAGVHTVHGSEVLAAHPSSPDPFKHLRILTTVVTSFFVETITCRNISSTYPFKLIGLKNILQCLICSVCSLYLLRRLFKVACGRFSIQ